VRQINVIQIALQQTIICEHLGQAADGTEQ
jgi:hypothetical protein